MNLHRALRALVLSAMVSGGLSAPALADQWHGGPPRHGPPARYYGHPHGPPPRVIYTPPPRMYMAPPPPRVVYVQPPPPAYYYRYYEPAPTFSFVFPLR